MDEECKESESTHWVKGPDCEMVVWIVVCTTVDLDMVSDISVCEESGSNFDESGLLAKVVAPSPTVPVTGVPAAAAFHSPVGGTSVSGSVAVALVAVTSAAGGTAG